MKLFRDTIAAEMDTKKAQRMGSTDPMHVLAMGVDLEKGECVARKHQSRPHPITKPTQLLSCTATRKVIRAKQG